MPRARDRILQNLESIYREAYERAKTLGDQARMADLDASYQREQLLLEVLLDIRDVVASSPALPQTVPGEGRAAPSAASDPIAALETIHRIAKLR